METTAVLALTQARAGFLAWMRAVATVLPAEVVALDGKTARRSHDRSRAKAAIHMVSAWAATNRLVLAQVKVEDKSNEITALPEMLRALALSGCIVTIDAMGCQRTIAAQIRDQEADYVLALKENQGTLYEDVGDTFGQARRTAFAGMTHETSTAVDNQSRIRQGYAAENLVVLRHIALNLLRHTPAKRLSIKAKRLRAGWDHTFLCQVLHGL